MPGLPVPIVDDFEWVRLQEEIKHEDAIKKELNSGFVNGVVDGIEIYKTDKYGKLHCISEEQLFDELAKMKDESK